jgi:hypothetical protein
MAPGEAWPYVDVVHAHRAVTIAMRLTHVDLRDTVGVDETPR